MLPCRPISGAPLPTAVTVALALVVAFVLPVTAGVQEEDQAEPRPTFDAAVSRVRVDVIVKDGEGRFVDDLRLEDFRLFEDGEEQRILDVQLVDLREESAEASRSLPDEVSAEEIDARGRSGAGTPADGSAVASVVAAPAVGSDLGAMVFLVDGPSMAHRHKARFADALTDLVEETGTLDIPRAFYVIDNRGVVHEIQGLTRDPREVEEAVRQVRELKITDNSIRQKLEELGSVPAEGRSSVAQAYEMAEKTRSLSTFEMLEQFCHALASRWGRTALVWVSSGMKLTEAGPYVVSAPRESDPDFPGGLFPGDSVDAAISSGERGLFTPDPQIVEAQEELHRAANSANVSLYSVDPSLPQETRGQGLVGMAIEAYRNPLRNAAEATGGRAYIGWTDLKKAAVELEADTGRFYLLTYEAPPPDGDGEYHEIRVEVARPGVDVRARRGYVDYASEVRRIRTVSAALALPGMVSDLPVAAQAFRGWSAPDQARVMLAAAVPQQVAGVRVDEEGTASAELEFHAVVVRDGEVVSELADRLVATRSGDENAEPRRSSGFFVYRHEWDVEPGSYDIRLAVVDAVSGRLAAASLEVTVEDTPEGDDWTIGDPIVVAVDPSRGPQPVVQGRLSAGIEAAVHAQVVNGVRPVLSGTLFTAAQEERGEPGMRIFALPMRPEGAGTFRGSLPLPRGLPPGRYTLQLAVTDQPAGRYEIVRIPLELGAPAVDSEGQDED